MRVLEPAAMARHPGDQPVLLPQVSTLSASHSKQFTGEMLFPGPYRVRRRAGSNEHLLSRRMPYPQLWSRCCLATVRRSDVRPTSCRSLNSPAKEYPRLLSLFASLVAMLLL